MTRDDFVFTDHAVDEMAEDGILFAEVIETVERGAVIEHYPDRKPLPAQLSGAVVGRTPMYRIPRDGKPTG